jgi:CubicO group peptidase (beta-lactamase class C family)
MKPTAPFRGKFSGLIVTPCHGLAELLYKIAGCRHLFLVRSYECVFDILRKYASNSDRCKMRFEFPIRTGASLLVVIALLIAACSRPGSTAGSSALKPIDKAALQAMVDTTARELMIPGAVVLLRTPQGEFTVTYGTTLLGAISPPRADTHFRIASNTKTMTAAVIVLLAQEGKLNLDDRVSKYVPGVPDDDKITITELLNMRSGLYTYDDDPDFWAVLELDPTNV